MNKIERASRRRVVEAVDAWRVAQADVAEWHRVRAELARHHAEAAAAYADRGEFMLPPQPLLVQLAELDEATWRTRAISLGEAARTFHLSVRTITAWARAGDVRAERRGKLWYACPEDVAHEAIARLAMELEDEAEARYEAQSETERDE